MQDESGHVVSKTRRKRDMLDLQALGVRLTGLNDAQLAGLDLPEDLRDALIEARRITRHEARRRHLQYIGRLMREVDPAPIRERLSQWEGQSRQATATQHRVERWRDELLADDAALAGFLAVHPGADSQHLRSLIRSVREDRAGGRAARQYRELFRELKRIVEVEQEMDRENGGSAP
jgi:ribosome-associated protein